MYWKPEYDAELLRGATARLSARKIAKNINDRFGTEYSRTAVLGRLARIRPTKSASNGAPFPPRKFKPEAEILRLLKTAADDAALEGKKQDDLGPLDCRWPIGNPGETGFRFCGRQVDDQTAPYCPCHGQRAYRYIKISEIPNGEDRSMAAA